MPRFAEGNERDDLSRTEGYITPKLVFSKAEHGKKGRADMETMRCARHGRRSDEGKRAWMLRHVNELVRPSRADRSQPGARSERRQRYRFHCAASAVRF